jgi:DNA-binding CsgD family transcriptional regulator
MARLEVELLLADRKPSDAVAAAADAVGRFDLAADRRYAWPLLTAAARAVGTAGRARRGNGELAGQAADLLARLHSLAGSMPARGPVQKADRLTFRAEALRAAAAVGSVPPAVAPAAALDAADSDGKTPAAQVLAAFDAAAAAWEADGQPYPLADALLRAAEAALATGDRDGAAARLRRAAELADGLGARPLAAEIQALARSARIRREVAQAGHKPAAATPLGLTAREFEVLRLVADGRSNPEIAARLFISAKTASVHVSNILGKTGVASRGEAAAAAHRLHLFDAVPTP